MDVKSVIIGVLSVAVVVLGSSGTPTRRRCAWTCRGLRLRGGDLCRAPCPSSPRRRGSVQIASGIELQIWLIDRSKRNFTRYRIK